MVVEDQSERSGVEHEPEPVAESAPVAKSQADSTTTPSAASTPAPLPKDWGLRNCTADRLTIKDADGHFITFAPLEVRRSAGAAAEWPLQELVDSEVICFEPPKTERNINWLINIGPGVAIFFAVVTAMIAGAYPGRDNYVWITAACLFGLFFILSAIISWKGGMTVRRQSAQFFMLLLVVILSVALPAAVAWRFGPEGFWLDTSLGAVARFIQLAFMSLACMVPGLLFFLFDRQRLSTLRDRFEQQIFRLDPNVATLADVYARFGSQIDETYGQVGEAVETRLTAQRRWPIIVATVALALGWIITLLPVGDLANTTTSDQVAQTFLPQSNAVSYGFLGAYFFSINLVLRRYARGDLRPKAYSAITVRILIVVILGWLIDTTIVEPPQWLLLAAFFIGIVPETFLTFFREVYRGQLVARFAQSLDEALPLQHLEGLDLYDRARLLDEGVTNIEALAHHDLIDLLLETRIPAGRLVDWVDQAILYLHLVNPLSEDGARHAYAASRQSLRKLGIRTATDLESVYNGHENGALLNALRKALSPNAEGADGKALSGNAEDGDGARLEILLASFQDDEWMKYVRNWRRRAMLWERTIEIDADGKIVEDQSKEITSVGVTGQDV